MSLFFFKTIVAILIFSIAVLAALLPKQFLDHHKGSRHLSDSITNGIFLGTAMFHMLPDAQETFHTLGIHHYLLYTFLFCVAGLLLMQLVKHTAKYLQRTDDSMNLNATIVLIALSLHSLIEGAALGVNTTIANTFVVFIAILAHKSCDSFALAATLRRYRILINQQTPFILIYATMTPIGIGIASTTISLLSNEVGATVAASLSALAAGTFIYIGTIDVMTQLQTQRLNQKISEFAVLLLGISIMGFIAMWI
jgi:solute carrier family 39 (zinc transporter), member 1/2/3